MKHRSGLGKLVLLISLVAGCSSNTKELPDSFNTHNFEEPHVIAAKKYIEFKGGIKGYGWNLDLDNDGMNDLYVVAKDSTVYHTSTRRLLTGEDSQNYRKWYHNTKESLKSARTGEHKALF